MGAGGEAAHQKAAEAALAAAAADAVAAEAAVEGTPLGMPTPLVYLPASMRTFARSAMASEEVGLRV